MKNAIAACIVGFVSLTGVSISRADSSSANTEKAIAALEMKWAQAQNENKPDLSAPLIADKILMIDPEGKLTNRAEFLAGEQSTHYSNVSVDDMKITVFGNTAIANYVLTMKGTDKHGAFDRRSRETDTWVKMPNGDWQCVAAHNSTLK